MHDLPGKSRRRKGRRERGMVFRVSAVFAGEPEQVSLPRGVGDAPPFPSSPPELKLPPNPSLV